MTLVAAYERQIGGRGTEINPGEPAPPVPNKPPVILHPATVPEAAAAAASPTAAPPTKIQKAKEEIAEYTKPHRRHIRKRHKHNDD